MQKYIDTVNNSTPANTNTRNFHFRSISKSAPFFMPERNSGTTVHAGTDTDEAAPNTNQN